MHCMCVNWMLWMIVGKPEIRCSVTDTNVIRINMHTVASMGTQKNIGGTQKNDHSVSANHRIATIRTLSHAFLRVEHTIILSVALRSDALVSIGNHDHHHHHRVSLIWFCTLCSSWAAHTVQLHFANCYRTDRVRRNGGVGPPFALAVPAAQRRGHALLCVRMSARCGRREEEKKHGLRLRIVENMRGMW